MAASKYNLNNPAIKRILSEVRELGNDTSEEFEAHPLEVIRFQRHNRAAIPRTFFFALL